MKKYDAIVIGSGGGNKAVSSLVKLSKKVALIERGKAGGTCLNRGCIPSKMLIYPAHLYHHLDFLDSLNIKTKDKNLAFSELISRINAHTDLTSEKIEVGRSESEKVDYYKGTAKFIADKIIKVNEEELTADKILIATGSRPFIPDIKGLAHTPFMTSNEALRAKKLPESMIVLGGGYIATELGGAYSALGTDVTFVVRSDFLKQVDEDLRKIFLKEFLADKTVYTNTGIQSAIYEEKKFKLTISEADGKTKEITADELLVCTGIIPNSDLLNLENTAIKTNQKGFIQVNQFLETSAEGIYAIGDVAGNYLFRHSVNFEAEYWIEANYLSASPFPVNYPPMPAAVFTNPEIASVGLTEAEAQQQSISYITGTAKYNSIAMAKARGLDTGFVKLIFDTDKHTLLGAHIIGSEAATMIQELALAATHSLTAEDIYRQIYIHPAFPEVIRNAVRNALKNMGKKWEVLF